MQELLICPKHVCANQFHREEERVDRVEQWFLCLAVIVLVTEH